MFDNIIKQYYRYIKFHIYAINRHSDCFIFLTIKLNAPIIKLFINFSINYRYYNKRVDIYIYLLIRLILSIYKRMYVWAGSVRLDLGFLDKYTLKYNFNCEQFLTLIEIINFNWYWLFFAFTIILYKFEIFKYIKISNYNNNDSTKRM